MQVASAEQVHAALPWPALAQAIEQAFVQGAHTPLRHAHALSADDTLLLMPSWDDSLIVTKLVTVIPQAPHTVQASLLVLDRASGAPLALLDGEALTLRRTAATSALVAARLAPQARHLLVVGSGRLAAWMARAHCALLPHIERVQVWGRDVGKAQRLAGVLAAEGLPATAAPVLEHAVRRAQLICCATTATTPLVLGQWLAPGTHLDLVGAFKPSMREVDDRAVQRARVLVDTYAGALAEAGDLVQPLQAGLVPREHVLAELAELLKGQHPVRRDAADITLFKSVGTALEDLAAARCVLSQLRQSGA
jgi:ornithine cyclodeaminase/alanine dehydrogenase-like protein (mu-crystallin family)